MSDSWPTAKLKDVTVDVKSWDPSSADEFTYVDISSIDNIRCEIVDPKRLPGADAPSRARRPIQQGDVLFSNVRTYLRNVAHVPELQQPAVASTGFTLLRPKPELESRYLYHLARSDFFIDRVTPEQTGTHYPATSDRVVRDQEIPLPSPVEQRAIAQLIDRIESSRQSSATHLAASRRAVDRFRQTVLAAACSGRLTAGWRELNAPADSAEVLLASVQNARRQRLGHRFKPQSPPVVDTEVPDNWTWTTVGALVDVATGATPLRTRADYYGGSIPWVTSGAVNAGLITEATEYITDLAVRETNAKVFPAGTLLVAMYGEGQTRGRVAELGIAAATNQAVAALVFDDSNEFLRDYLRTFFLENYERIRLLSFGGVQPNLSLGVIRDTPIPLPPIDEQVEIVRRVDQLSELATSLRTRIDAATRRVDRSSQAVLAKVFRGDLSYAETR